MLPSDPTTRTQVRRHPERGDYDPDAVRAIIDEALICHVAVAVNGQPRVLPMLHARGGDNLYLHGSHSSQLLAALKSGAEACVVFTLLDGLVLARSAFHHSLNYRSVVLFGRGRDVTDPAEKGEALRLLVEHAAPGRWEEARQPTPAEEAGTAVVALPIQEASAKVRVGPPKDNPLDEGGPWWAGIVPLQTVALPPLPAPGQAPDAPAPPSVTGLLRKYALQEGPR